MIRVNPTRRAVLKSVAMAMGAAACRSAEPIQIGSARGGKGAVTQYTFHPYKDAHTGREVVRLTPPSVLHHHPYFYNRMVTRDDQHLLLAGMVDGQRQLLWMDLRNGETVQLTQGAKIGDFGAQLSEDDRYVFFVRDRAILRLDLSSLLEELIYETPVGWTGNGTPGKSSDDRFLVTVEMDQRDALPPEPVVQKVQDPSTTLPRHLEQWKRKPRCRLVYVDVDRKAGRVIHEEAYWLGHPQLRPHDPDTILYCHEGPWGDIDSRLWLIQSDGSRMRSARPRTGAEEIGHEYWLADGSRVAYVYYPGKKGINGTIRLLDPATLREETLMACSGYDHLISNHDNSRITGDGSPPMEPFIYIVDVAKRQETKVCWHGTRYTTYGSTQDAHPHPAFSPSGRQLIFTSDKDGMPAVYKTNVSDLT